MSLLEDDISVFIWIFQFCSFLSPISKTNFWLKNVSFALWSLAHLGFAILELTFIYIYHNDTFHDGSEIGKILDIVQVILPISAHMIFLLETIFNWNIQFEMWELIKTVEKRTELIRVKKDSFLKTFLIEVSTLAFVGMVTEAVILASIITDESFARSWYLRLWSLYMIRFAMMQLIFYVEWIRCHINVIRKGLVNATNDECNVKLLHELKILYSDLWLFSLRFNKRFAWSILALMIHLFITIVICLYWIVARLYFNVLDVLLASIFICISPITNLLVLLYSCQQCVTQVRFPFYVTAQTT